jgi:5-methylcytosine-specific restriction endonuclease McrA
MARAGGDRRGSSADRRRRREWLVSPASGFGGDGVKVACYWECGTELTEATVEADRIVPGGSYRRDNIVPACRDCNLARSDDGDLTVADIRTRVAAMMQKRGGVRVPALVG